MEHIAIVRSDYREGAEVDQGIVFQISQENGVISANPSTFGVIMGGVYQKDQNGQCFLGRGYDLLSTGENSVLVGQPVEVYLIDKEDYRPLSQRVAEVMINAYDNGETAIDITPLLGEQLSSKISMHLGRTVPAEGVRFACRNEFHIDMQGDLFEAKYDNMSDNQERYVRR